MIPNPNATPKADPNVILGGLVKCVDKESNLKLVLGKGLTSKLVGGAAEGNVHYGARIIADMTFYMPDTLAAGLRGIGKGLDPQNKIHARTILKYTGRTIGTLLTFPLMTVGASILLGSVCYKRVFPSKLI